MFSTYENFDYIYYNAVLFTITMFFVYREIKLTLVYITDFFLCSVVIAAYDINLTIFDSMENFKESCTYIFMYLIINFNSLHKNERLFVGYCKQIFIM